METQETPVYGMKELIRHYRENRENDQILTILSGMADEEPAEVIRALKLAGEDVTGLAGKQARTPHMGKSRMRTPDPGISAVKKGARLREAGKTVGEVAKATGMTYVQVQRIASYAAEYGIEYTPADARGKYDHTGIKHPGKDARGLSRPHAIPCGNGSKGNSSEQNKEKGERDPNGSHGIL